MADVSKSYTTDSYEIQDEGGMYLRDVYIQGASWDTENNCLSHSRYVYNASGISLSRSAQHIEPFHHFIWFTSLPRMRTNFRGTFNFIFDFFNKQL